MFQFNIGGASYSNYLYINTYDEMIKNTYELVQENIFAITSQQTGKQKLFFPYQQTPSTHYKRYIKYHVKYIKTEVPGVFDPNAGWIALNNKDFPYGFYDMQIWQNDPGYTALNLDNVIKLLYTGNLNVTPISDSGNTEVEYTEYNNNDSETDNVYLTTDIS